MPSQVYILIAAAAVMFLIMGGLSLLAHYSTLNGIKSRTVGDGQHGTARFSTKQEIKSIYKHIPFQPELWRKGESLPAVSEQGIILGSTGAKNKVTALVDMRTRLRLFLDWGIRFGKPYTVAEKAHRKVMRLHAEDHFSEMAS